MPNIKSYLQRALARGYREFAHSLDQLSAEEARAGSRPDWRRFRFGTGLDGSIAGILIHVTAWKHVVADGLATGTFPDPEAVLLPDPDWPALLEWLARGHARLLRELEQQSEADLERVYNLEGETLSAVSLFTIAIEHDHYHAGQVNLIRQQRGHDLTD